MSYESEGYTYLIRQSLSEAAKRYSICGKMAQSPISDPTVVRSVRATRRVAHALVAEAVSMAVVMRYNGYEAPEGTDKAVAAFSAAYSMYETHLWGAFEDGDDTNDDVEGAEDELEDAAYEFANVFAFEGC